MLLAFACGPGSVSCPLASHLRPLIGLALVPAMLDRAERLQSERGLGNRDWQMGESTDLPFMGATFDGVVTRFSFHHFLESLRSLREI
jgi:ubiquinone/menaquinone biosynthesis C-methylase UbiE